MTTTDQDALLAAIDEGGDRAAYDGGAELPVLALADWLGERGDPREAGLRAVAPRYERKAAYHLMAGFVGGHPPFWQHGGDWVYWRADEGKASSRGVIAAAVFDRLAGGRLEDGYGTTKRCYPSRSAAFLALAAALTPEEVA